jgi:molecular chaperone GrpE (heat shock protein)
MSDPRDDVTGRDENTATEDAGEGTGVGLVDDPMAAMESRVQELEARLRTVSAAYRQKQEEIDATKDRLARHAAVQEEIRRGEVVAQLFDPVENLLRSIEAMKGQPVEQGLRMIHGQFMDALKRLGLEEVPGVGSPFNPNLHEAIAQAPVTERDQDNRVLVVHQTGYRIGNRLIRPARVVIGSYTEPSAEA